MDRILLDANAVLSYLTNREPAQQVKIEQILESAVRGDAEILLHQQALSEMIFVLKNVYRVRADVIAKMLFDLIHQPGTLTTNDLEWERVLKLWPSQIVDFGDAVLASAALMHDWKIATFDKSFQKQLKTLKIAWT